MKYEDFLKKAKEVHGNKYIYPEFNDTPVAEKISIICPEHGEFKQVIYAHLRGQNCPKCVRAKAGYSTEDFIRDAKDKFGDKFDYSKSVYTGRRNKVCIMCKDLVSDENPNGEFWQKPLTHLNSKTGMPFKGKRGREYPVITNEEKIEEKTVKFVEKLQKIFGDKYEYHDVVYTGCFQKVKILCPTHGVFEAMPTNLLKGHGCPHCAKIAPMSLEEFIKKARDVHGDKYDYSKVKIGKTDEKVCIICPEHGEFFQTISRHLRGSGCHICAGNKKKTTKSFIEESKKVHGNKYDYSKVEYMNNHTKVCIICPEHGEFWQTPSEHLQGRGCIECGTKSIMEEEMKKFLDENNIQYTKQKKFKTIKYKKMLPFDFYLPKYNALIECQGIQHFEENEFFKDDERFIKDGIKHKMANENGLKLFYYTNIKDYQKYFNNIYNENNTFDNKIQLLNELKKA